MVQCALLQLPIKFVGYSFRAIDYLYSSFLLCKLMSKIRHFGPLGPSSVVKFESGILIPSYQLYHIDIKDIKDVVFVLLVSTI